MSATVLGLVALAYLGVAVDLFLTQRWGLSLAFVAYAFANLGFIWDITGAK